MAAAEPIEIEVWRPAPDRPGYVTLDHRRQVHEVLAELNARLEVEGLAPDEYGFTDSTRYEGPAIEWPAYRWIAAYAVTGGSEGHYIHIDAITPDHERRAIALGLAKTFQGWQRACEIAAAVGRLLGA